MGKDDYTSTGGGLKLKGVKGGGIDKHKKKKKKIRDTDEPNATGDLVKSNSEARSEEHRVHDSAGTEKPLDPADSESKQAAMIEKELATAMAEREAKSGSQSIKTEAERRHEEMRRKRLSERLAREGVKTHKERVEELNKYLSNLSEHHDMPRIGPG